MKGFLLTVAVFVLVAGCTIHEPTYYTVYSPTHPLTNSQPSAVTGTNSWQHIGS